MAKEPSITPQNIVSGGADFSKRGFVSRQDFVKLLTRTEGLQPKNWLAKLAILYSNLDWFFSFMAQAFIHTHASE